MDCYCNEIGSIMVRMIFTGTYGPHRGFSVDLRQHIHDVHIKAYVELGFRKSELNHVIDLSSSDEEMEEHGVPVIPTLVKEEEEAMMPPLVEVVEELVMPPLVEAVEELMMPPLVETMEIARMPPLVEEEDDELLMPPLELEEEDEIQMPP